MTKAGLSLIEQIKAVNHTAEIRRKASYEAAMEIARHLAYRDQLVERAAKAKKENLAKQKAKQPIKKRIILKKN